MRPRPLENRLGQVEGRRGAVAIEEGAAGVRQRRLLRAEAALGEIIREALARADADAAAASRLALADDAAAALAAIPDTARLRHADADDAAASANGYDRARADMFAPKIIAMIHRFAGGARRGRGAGEFRLRKSVARGAPPFRLRARRARPFCPTSPPGDPPSPTPQKRPTAPASGRPCPRPYHAIISMSILMIVDIANEYSFGTGVVRPSGLARGAQQARM